MTQLLFASSNVMSEVKTISADDYDILAKEADAEQMVRHAIWRSIHY